MKRGKGGGYFTSCWRDSREKYRDPEGSVAQQTGGKAGGGGVCVWGGCGVVCVWGVWCGGGGRCGV